MKKIFALLMAASMMLSFAACGNKDAEKETEAATEAVTEATTEEATEAPTESADMTIGETLRADFLNRAENSPEETAQAYADALLANPVCEFAGATMPVEEGLLTGFGNDEIKGFKEGVMFSPMIGTIPFVGYIFILEDGSDVEGFMSALKSNANLAWNVCTEADELFVESSGNTVFFLMSPNNFEE